MNIVQAILKIALLGSSWVLWLLLALSVLSFGIALERIYVFRKRARTGGDELEAELQKFLDQDDAEGAEKVLAESGTFDGAVVLKAFKKRDGGARAFDAVLEGELGRRRLELEKGLNFLGTMGSNAPFIGLFGTVIGVIVAFHELGSAAARAGAMGNVMSGIAEALVATGVGLFVAIPAVIAYNMAQQRLTNVEQDTQSLGKIALAWIEANEHTFQEEGVAARVSHGR